jgi:hypothetical protein
LFSEATKAIRRKYNIDEKQFNSMLFLQLLGITIIISYVIILAITDLILKE